MRLSGVDRVAIGIPVYNGEAYLKDAIGSAINQTESADEIIIFVHDSTDRSLAIAQSFCPHVSVIHENSSLSIGEAWNAVYRHSSCDYVIMLHADDFLVPNAIATIKATIAKDNSLEVIFGDWRVLLADGKVIGGDSNKTDENLLKGTDYMRAVLKDGFLPPCSGTCIKRSLILENGFRTDLDIVLDCEFFSRASWTTKVNEIALNLATYRIHQASTVNNNLAVDKTRQDLYKWWYLLESKEIEVPPEILPTYRAALFRKIIHAFIQDLWRHQSTYIPKWIDLIHDVLAKYPYLGKDAFTIRSLAIYKIAGMGRFGYEVAAFAAWLSKKMIDARQIAKHRSFTKF